MANLKVSGVIRMKRSYLIQRLKKPIGTDAPRANLFSFGATNGGFSKEALELCHGCFDFDYMGAAEFEWGAVPEALATIHDSSLARGKIEEMYYLCIAEMETEVRAFIETVSKGELEERKLKEPLGTKRDSVLGWLELDNCFFFFRDEEMWKNTCKLFGKDVD